MPSANSRCSSGPGYLVEAIESVIAGQAEPAAALAEAQEKADEVLGEYQ